MSQSLHRVYVGTMIIFGVVVTIYLAYTGFSYYQTPLEERFYHPRHDWFRPSGLFGHGLGIVGTLMILFGVTIYIVRKRYNFLSRLIRLKYLLEFHIFLCSLGPVLILFHTAFKFGGIVSIAFWSMVAVVLSGVIGRFIYIQIPRTIEGRQLSLQEVQNLSTNLADQLKTNEHLDEKILGAIDDFSQNRKQQSASWFREYWSQRALLRKIKVALKSKNISSRDKTRITQAVRSQIDLSFKIRRLNRMQQLFKYWHVAHLPFALIMLIIVVIHVIITLSFGYKWIF